MALKQEVISKTSDHVRLVRVGRDAARFWNSRRRPDDTVAFCGWFWIKLPSSRVRGPREGGPFPTPSAAMRDAYYRFVLQRDLPGLGVEVTSTGDIR